MALQPHASPFDRAWHYGLRVFCAMGLLYLILPILVIIPLSFNAEAFFSYPMPGFSLRWYQDLLASSLWIKALKNSLVLGLSAASLATIFGTLAAFGMHHAKFSFKALIMGLLISPMIVPHVITAVAVFFFFSKLNLTGDMFGMILAHTALTIPFVIITVSASLAGYDPNLPRAAASLGANPATTFFRITMPLIMPGLVSGALFAFAISFDELVVMLFIAGPEQRTLPLQMWTGIRDDVTPLILAAATLLILLAVCLLVAAELLRRRTEKIKTSLRQP